MGKRGCPKFGGGYCTVPLASIRVHTYEQSLLTLVVIVNLDQSIEGQRLLVAQSCGIHRHFGDFIKYCKNVHIDIYMDELNITTSGSD